MEGTEASKGTPRRAPPAIHLESVGKIYRDFWGRGRTWALRDLSLSVTPGEIFGLLGPNGSGKTTALKVMMGLIRSSSGKATVLGRRPGDPEALARVGYLPEEPAHYGFLTGLESLEFYGRLFRLDRRERRKRARELVETLGLQAQGSKAVREYSRGIARRLGIAQALVNRPDLLILDEPTSGLDPVAHRMVTDLFLRLREEGKTILVSSHLLADVEKVCDRIGILEGGGLLVEGKVDDLLTEDDAMQCRIRGVPEETLRRVIEGAGGEVAHSRPARRTLHDLFLRVLKRGGKG